VLGTGYVLFFFSERIFWSMWRPGDAIEAYIATWLVYSLLGYLLLATIRSFHVDNLWALFLAGAVFGWLTEGIYAMTLFGDASMPFPLTISWTGLAWHSLISVVIGWYALRRALQARNPWTGLWVSLAIGTFWGLWAFGWTRETPPLIAEPFEFLAHVAITTACLAASQWLISFGDLASFRPSRLGLVITLGIVFAFFALVTIPRIPWSPAVIVPLFTLTFFALWRHRAREQGSDALTKTAAPIPPRNLIGLFGIPVAAFATYYGLNAAQLPVPAHHIISAVTTLVGFVIFAIAVYAVAFGSGVPPTLATHRIIGSIRHGL